AEFESSASMDALLFLEARDVTLELLADGCLLAALLTKILLLGVDIVVDMNQVFRDLIRHGRGLWIVAIRPEPLARDAQLLHTSVQYLEELTRDLDLIGQQRQALIAQPLDFRHGDVGVQQVFVPVRSLFGLKSLLFF